MATTKVRRSRQAAPLFTGIILVGSLAMLGSGITSLAIWTDTGTTSAAFSAGTLDLTTSQATILTVNAIAPGQSGSAALTVTNSGTLALRYALTSSSTDADGLGLRDQLEMTVSAGACPGSTVLSGPAALAGAAFGDPTQGEDTGDRTLAAAAAETLCFAWSLPASTNNTYQGAATSTTFTFAAEQTVANP